MKKIFLMCAFIFISQIINFSFAQAPAIQWQKTYGGTGQELMYFGKKQISTSDGGYILAGKSKSSDGDVTINKGGNDVWIVKTNATGTVLWQKTFGGTNEEGANSIQQTTDGGYIVAGFTQSNDGDVTLNHGNGSSDYWVLKLDASGNLLWQKTYGGTANDFAFSVQQTTDGAYIVFGSTGSVNNGDVTGFHGYSDYWAVKIDASGNLLWQKAFGGNDNEEGISIQQTTDGGYIMTGLAASNDGDVTGNHGSSDFWVVKTDASGSLQWQKALGGTDQDVSYDVKQTNDGGYIVTGYTLSTDGDVTGKQANTDYWVVKLNSGGALQWQKTYGGNSEDYAYTIQLTNDGGYILSGYTLSTAGDVTGNHGASDIWIVKINSTGNLQWQKAIGGSSNEISYGIQQTPDGGYIVAGNTNSNDGDATGNHGSDDFWLVKLASACSLNVSAGADEHLYFGFAPQQCKTKTVTVTGGTTPYTYSWTLDRPLLINVVNATGDETVTGSSTASLTVCLLDTAVLCVAVTDANGCTASDCATIFAEDVRCFSGNSGTHKVRICHNGNSICVDSNAVSAHLNHGDYVGQCGAIMANFSPDYLQEEEAKFKFDIYPNPGNGNITLILNLNPEERKNASIQVVNMNGQVAKRIDNLNKDKITFTLKTNGVYFIKLITNKTSVIKKLIVNN